MEPFTYIDKGTGRALLILPGWGFHPFVIDPALLNFDLVIPSRPLLNPLFLVNQVNQIIKKNSSKELNMLGWSLGARLALDTVLAAPQLFKKTVLVSLPSPFDKKVIAEKHEQLEKDLNKALKGFYMSVFQDNIKAYKRFKKEQEGLCLSFWTKESLVEGLEILARPLPQGIENIRNLLIIHGTRDTICPIGRLPALSKENKQKTVILDCGHAPFLIQDFYDAINKL